MTNSRIYRGVGLLKSFPEGVGGVDLRAASCNIHGKEFTASSMSSGCLV